MQIISSAVDRSDVLIDSRKRVRTRAGLLATTALLGSLIPHGALAQTLPTGASVAAGSVTFSQPSATQLNVVQSSQSAVVNYQSFSIGQGASVNFVQPNASSAILNRVTGNATSNIAGSITANGSVYLVNPNGIAITRSGTVNAGGGFVASTLGIQDSDFMAGKRTFTGNGASAGISNAGRITVGRGGYAALIGGTISNSGLIDVPLGKVGLGSGERATLDFAGDGFLQVAVPTNAGGGRALIRNSGSIKADGGSVVISAATARDAARNAINISGTVQARSIGGRNGAIVIGGGTGGIVKVSGRLVAGSRTGHGGTINVTGRDVRLKGATVDASGKTGGGISIGGEEVLKISNSHIGSRGEDGTGGRIDLSGKHVALAGTSIDASGATSGGLVRIGGTFQGGHGDPGSALYQASIGRFGALPDIASAQTTMIDAATTIDVSARTTSNAGTAIVWSDLATSFAGEITGTGGVNGGNGGFAEVSGKQSLEFEGAVDLSAKAGAIGTLLLDPVNITISTSAANNIGGTSAGGTTTYTPTTATTSVVRVSTLQTALATTNVVINAAGAGAAAGTITVANAVTWTSGNSLTLNATSNITVNAAVTGLSGALVLNPGAGSTVAINAAVSVSTLTINGTGAVTQTGAITASNLLLSGAGASYTLTNAANNIGTVAANTGSLSLTNAASLTVGTVGGTTGITATGAVALTTTGATSDIIMNGAVATPTGTLTLTSGRNISAAGAVNVGTFVLQAGNWSQNTAALPSFAANDFRINGGTFLRVTGGAGTSPSPYTINDVYGLQGIATLTTRSFALASNIDATGTTNWNAGAGFVSIGGGAQQFTGSFDGRGHTINGIVINRPSTNFVGLFGTVRNATVANVGLVGGSIRGSVSVGSVAGYQSGGSITRTFSTASVNGAYSVGGLVGFQETGSITQSYAAGAVTGSGDYIGGLVGSQSGSINQSYATGAVTGVNSVGGLVGDTFLGTIAQSYAVGLVSGTSAVGGLIGSSDTTTTTSSYWDKQTSGQSISAGGSGLTTAQMQDLASFQTTYSGWNFQSIWAPGNQVGQGGSATAYYPQLYALTAVVWDQADSKTRIYGDSNPSFTATLHGGPGSYVFGPAGDTLTVSSALSTTASQNTGVGSYAITNTTPVSATSSLGIAYRIVRTDSTIAVTPRALTVTADAQSRAYGDANPVLTYQVGGLVNGDTLSGALTTSATAQSNVGSYAITRGTLAASANYTLSYTGANLSVTPRALTITADAQTRAYGEANPPLTYSIGGAGLVNGDMLSGALATSATPQSPLGSYAITQGSLTAPANYALSYVGANLVVTAGPVDVATLPSSIVRDNTDAISLTGDRYVVEALSLMGAQGIGTFYADPRFDRIFVCQIGDGKTVAPCVTARTIAAR